VGRWMGLGVDLVWDRHLGWVHSMLRPVAVWRTRWGRGLVGSWVVLSCISAVVELEDYLRGVLLMVAFALCNAP